MPLVDKLLGNQNNFSDLPYLKQQRNGGWFSKGTVYVPTKKTCPYITSLQVTVGKDIDNKYDVKKEEKIDKEGVFNITKEIHSLIIGKDEVSDEMEMTKL